jgi:tetratricopeptide (TPR) repeat protein
MSDEWPEELRLDGSAGPAPYLQPSVRDALVENVLAQAYPARKRASWLAAAIAVACIAGGSASAAVLWYARHDEPAVVAPKPAAVAAPRVIAAPAVKPIVVEPSLLEPTPIAPRPTVRAAEDWLREGNRLRAARRWKQADDAYGAAAQEAISDEAAYVAFVASAGVRLEHLNDARGALARYRAALKASPHGALDEEIRFGIADAYRALGDAAREREALQTFLRDHPQSPLTEQARARLR